MKKKHIIRVKLTDKLYRFKHFYKLTSLWKKSLIILTSSLITAFLAVLFIQNSGLYIPGLESISQGIARISYYAMIRDGYSTSTSYLVFTILFWLIYFIFNIPLIIFSWFKISKEFSKLSFIYIAFNSIFAICFSLIPSFDTLYVFTNFNTFNIPDTAPIKSTLDNLTKYNLNYVSWTNNLDATKQLPVLLAGLIWGGYQAVNYAILLILNGSTGGLDFVGVYTAKTKYKDFGTSLNIFNLIFFIVGYLIGTYIPISEILRLDSNVQQIYATTPYHIGLLFSPNFLSVIAGSILFSIFLNAFFPKYSLVRVEIYTTKAKEIRDTIVELNKPYTLTVYDAKGSYNYKPQTVLVTTCMYLDTDDLLSIVRDHDDKAFFSISKIKKVDGYLYMYKE